MILTGTEARPCWPGPVPNQPWVHQPGSGAFRGCDFESRGQGSGSTLCCHQFVDPDQNKKGNISIRLVPKVQKVL